MQELDYISTLQDAIKRTKDHGILSQGYKHSEASPNIDKLMTFTNVAQDIIEDSIHAGMLPLEKYRLACVDIHLKLEDLLRKKNFKPLMTFGEVYIDGVPQFNASLEDLTQEITGSNMHSDKNVNLHAWITLGPLIVDITIVPWAYREDWLAGNLLQRNYQVIKNHADPLHVLDGNKVEHCPLFVGRDFAHKLMDFGGNTELPFLDFYHVPNF